MTAEMAVRIVQGPDGTISLRVADAEFPRIAD
jgi:hypothetical protein